MNREFYIHQKYLSQKKEKYFFTHTKAERIHHKQTSNMINVNGNVSDRIIRLQMKTGNETMKQGLLEMINT